MTAFVRRVLVPVLLATLVVVGLRRWLEHEPRPVRVGVLHSLTGTMAVSEAALRDAVLLAVDDVNARGGVLGRRVEAVVADGRSDPDHFAAEAGRLIREERVAAVFGCWTSACRRTVRPVVEDEDHLLVYPLQYEGLEASPNVLYMGAAPNQQIIPALRWALLTRGRRIYLVGSDYVFPRTAHEIVRSYAELWHADVVGEDYLPLGTADVDAVVARIAALRPDVVLSSINGDTNVAFFRALREAGLQAADVPVVSFSLGEEELRAMGGEMAEGHYAAWSYFQSLATPSNRRWVAAYRERFGAERSVGDPVVSAYEGVLVWAEAVRRAGSVDPARVRAALGGVTVAGPGDMVHVDSLTRHAWRVPRVGRVRADGQFDVVWEARAPVRPVPFPETRTRQAWEAFLDDLYRGWGGRWQAPDTPPTVAAVDPGDGGAPR